MLLAYPKPAFEERVPATSLSNYPSTTVTTVLKLRNNIPGLILKQIKYFVCIYVKVKKKRKTRRSRWCAGNHRRLMLKCQKTKYRGGHLGFLWPFINQFLPNLVPTYKMYSWTIFVLCVVFKCQYFLDLFKKNWFLTIYTYF